MNVTVVTPWVNHPEFWDDYWEAIQAGEPDELIVVDNHSEPPLEFGTLRPQRNLGFSGGCNLGLRHAHTDVVVFLNNDIRLVRPTWLHEIKELVEPSVLVGPLRIDPHAWVDGKPFPYLDGWCLAGMREDLNTLGGFDESLEEPAYFSDNLLCLEARVAGMTLREAHVGLYHKGSRTSLPGENPEVHAVTARNREKYLARARQVLSPITS